MEHLQKSNALTLCATHYHELTVLAQELAHVENFCVRVEENGDQIVFLRKILHGEADKSYGVQVARLAGLPKSIVKRALDVMENLEKASMVRHLPISIKESNLEKKSAIDENHDTNSEQNSSIEKNLQLSLFPQDSIYLDELKKLNLNEMTPLQALNFLYEFKSRLDKI